jgi:hypothetical protein
MCSPQELPEPPAWVQADPVCMRMWQESPTWQEYARVESHPATQRLLARLARELVALYPVPESSEDAS